MRIIEANEYKATLSKLFDEKLLQQKREFEEFVRELTEHIKRLWLEQETSYLAKVLRAIEKDSIIEMKNRLELTIVAMNEEILSNVNYFAQDVKDIINEYNIEAVLSEDSKSLLKTYQGEIDQALDERREIGREIYNALEGVVKVMKEAGNTLEKQGENNKAGLTAKQIKKYQETVQQKENELRNIDSVITRRDELKENLGRLDEGDVNEVKKNIEKLKMEEEAQKEYIKKMEEKKKLAWESGRLKKAEEQASSDKVKEEETLEI